MGRTQKKGGAPPHTREKPAAQGSGLHVDTSGREPVRSRNTPRPPGDDGSRTTRGAGRGTSRNGGAARRNTRGGRAGASHSTGAAHNRRGGDRVGASRN